MCSSAVASCADCVLSAYCVLLLLIVFLVLFVFLLLIVLLVPLVLIVFCIRSAKRQHGNVLRLPVTC